MKKKIGIIGGAGPMASCLLYQEIIRTCQQVYGCKNDQDFPEIVVINYPFSNMLNVSDIIKNKTALIGELQECFDRLKQQQINIVVIACNTLHTLLDYIKTDIELCIRIDTVIKKYIQQQKLDRVAVFSTETTATLGLYGSQHNAYATFYTNNQDTLNIIINNVLAGTVSDYEIGMFSQLIEELYKTNPFDGLVLGCTELSLLYKPIFEFLKAKISSVKLLDTTRLLASNVVQISFS